MSKRHYQPFYWGDYLRDTGQLNLLEHGAYLRLIGEYWNTGKPIPADAARMRRACGAQCEQDAEALQYVLERFFVRDGNVWRHSRIDRDLKEHDARASKASEAASRAANARWHGTETDASSMRAVCVSDANHPTPPQTNTPKIKSPERGGVGDFSSKTGGEYSVLKLISVEAREAARSACPGYDVYYLAGRYNEGINSGEREAPKNPNKAFPGWCKSYWDGIQKRKRVA